MIYFTGYHKLRAPFFLQAVNILRTAPHVCTMLIESCVAAPATPNGKPAMPGTESASAFYHPNRQQQMQPMMQRQASLESQYSSMQQQFVPSQSHQIEDIVAVSTPNLTKTKPVTTLPFGKQKSIEAIAWAQPFEKGAVSAMIRERAKTKVTVVNENGSLEGLSEKSKEAVSLPRDGELLKDAKTSENSKQHSDASREESQPILQGECSLADESSKLLISTEQQAPQNEESNVVGFFKRIQSFLFSPTPSKSKRTEESESSCCESDFDSEFSEMTQGSFNPGDIEAIRDELETLLSSSSTQDHGTGDEIFYGEASSSQQGVSLTSEKDVRATDSDDKCMLEMKENKVDQKDEKHAKELKDDSYLKGKEAHGVSAGTCEIMSDNKHLVNAEIKQIENEDLNPKVEDASGGMEEIQSAKVTKIHYKTGEEDTSSKDAENGKRENNQDPDNRESLVYSTEGVFKFQRETTV